MRMTFKNTSLTHTLCLVMLFFACQIVSAQYINTDIKARILFEKNSEFITFKAVGENVTLADRPELRYEFIVYKKDDGNNTSKSSQSDRFFLKANERKSLSSVTINYNVESHLIIALLIYDNDKPVGQARIELPQGGKSDLDSNPTLERIEVSKDQAQPQGRERTFLEGLVIENTITKAGKDFYRIFYQQYLNSQIKSSKNIVIDEVPGRSRSTRVSVKVDGQLVWQFFAQPRKQFLQQMAETAFQKSIAYLQRLQNQQNRTKY